MTHAPLRSLCATTALCAVLALGSTSAWAQDTAAVPDAVVAPAAPSAAPPPVIQLPTQAPAPAIPAMTAEPMVQRTPTAPVTPATAAEEPAPRSTAARRPLGRASTATRASAPGAAPGTAEPVTAPPVTTLPSAASVPVAQPAVPAPPPAAAVNDAGVDSDTSDGLRPGAWAAALIALFGAGAATYFATRSRRRRDVDVHEEAYEAAPPQTYVEPQPVMTAASEKVALEAPLPAFATIEDVSGEPEHTRELIGSEELALGTPNAEAYVMPSGPVPRGEARDAILKAMVDAPPDEKNPFHSRKARLRRARLILQHIEQQQKQDATQPFDWRTYKPVAGTHAPATPPRVTA